MDKVVWKFRGERERERREIFWFLIRVLRKVVFELSFWYRESIWMWIVEFRYSMSKGIKVVSFDEYLRE